MPTLPFTPAPVSVDDRGWLCLAAARDASQLRRALAEVLAAEPDC
jgi:hypothetical protein